MPAVHDDLDYFDVVASGLRHSCSSFSSSFRLLKGLRPGAGNAGSIFSWVPSQNTWVWAR